MIKYTCHQQNGYIVMSDNHLIKTITSERSSAEYARISAILYERNLQLRDSEDDCLYYQGMAQDARFKMWASIVVVIALIAVIAMGGAL